MTSESAHDRAPGRSCRPRSCVAAIGAGPALPQHRDLSMSGMTRARLAKIEKFLGGTQATIEDLLNALDALDGASTRHDRRIARDNLRAVWENADPRLVAALEAIPADD